MLLLGVDKYPALIYDVTTLIKGELVMDYIVSERTLDRTTVQYNSEHREFDIMVNGRRIWSMNPAQFSYFCYTIEPAQELGVQAEVDQK